MCMCDMFGQWLCDDSVNVEFGRVNSIDIYFIQFLSRSFYHFNVSKTDVDLFSPHLLYAKKRKR